MFAKSSTKKKDVFLRRVLIYGGIYLLSVVLHYVCYGVAFTFFINGILAAIMVAVWGATGDEKDPVVKKYRIILSITMLFWTFVKGCRDNFLLGNELLRRYAWYAYYVAIIFLPLFSYEVADYTSSDRKNERTVWRYILRSIAIVLTLGIFTNDLHRLAFRFPKGIEAWDNDYSRSLIYYLVAAFVVGLFLITFIKVIKKCTLPKCRKNLWVPILILVLFLTYLLLYLLNKDLRIQNIRIFALTDTFCLFLILFYEALAWIYRKAQVVFDEEALISQEILLLLKPEMTRARELLNEETPEEDYRKNLSEAMFLHTYVKRMGNLMILREANPWLESGELSLSVAEVLQNMKADGKETFFSVEGQKTYPAGEIVKAFQKFGETLEPIYREVAVLFVNMDFRGNEPMLRIQAEDVEGGALC